MQLTLNADELARALDVAATPYRSVTPRPKETAAAGAIKLETTPEGLLCTGHGGDLTARTLAEHRETAPALAATLMAAPALMPARFVRAVCAALKAAGQDWATLSTTATSIFVDAHGFTAPVEMPNLWGRVTTYHLDGWFHPHHEGPLPATELHALLSPSALAALTSTLHRYVHPDVADGLVLTPNEADPALGITWTFQNWAMGVITPAQIARVNESGPHGLSRLRQAAHPARYGARFQSVAA